MKTRYAAAAATLLLTCGVAGASTVTLGTTGSTAPVSTVQPSLALTAMVQINGEYSNDLGQIKFFAGNFAVGGFALAEGQLLAISQNQALYSKFGTTYGGDGRTTFALPDLRGRAVVGTGGTYSLGDTMGSPTVALTDANLPAHSHNTPTGATSSTGANTPYNNMQPGLALDFEIVDQGIYPSRNGGSAFGPPEQTLGFVQIDAATDGAGGSTFDRDKATANGTLVPISQNTALFSLVGTTYGGDGRTTFALPNVEDRIVVGEGNGPGLSDRRLGATQGVATETLTVAEMATHVHSDPDLGGNTDPAGSGFGDNNIQPEVTMNWVVAVTGIFPSRGGGSGSYGDTILGEIGLFAGNFAPSGWAFADGQLLSIAQNSALFSILGTTYGGDGRTTFALPDLRGRTPIGASFGSSALGYGMARLGTKTGSEQNQILPAHDHTIERIDVVPVPASLPLLMAGMGALGLASRRRKKA